MSSRSLLNYVAHKVIGARASPYLFPDQFQINNNNNNDDYNIHNNNNKRYPNMEPESNFGIIYNVQEIVKKHRLIFCGEIHSEPSIVAFQYALLDAMCCLSDDIIVPEESRTNNNNSNLPTADSVSSAEKNENNNIEIIRQPENIQQQQQQKRRKPVVHVIMEHFSFEMQQLLDDYLRNKTINTFDEFNKRYHEIGMEGHDLETYKVLLNYARDHPDLIYIHAGFIPRKYARMLIQEGPQVVLENASEYLPTYDDNYDIFIGTSLHYRVFESLLTGQPIINVTNKNETNKIDPDRTSSANDVMLQKIFPAQVLKDVAMANKVNEIITTSNKDDKFLVIAGNGHVLHYCGVPERVLTIHPELADETCVIVSASAKKSKKRRSEKESTNNEVQANDTSPSTSLDLILQDIIDRFGPKGTNPADYIYLYESQDEFP